MERVNAPQQLAMMPIEFKLNGKTVIGRPDETIIETAKKHGIEIPRLCYKAGMRPDGNCRACMVEIKGERVLAPSCCRYPDGRAWRSPPTARARVHSQKMVLELLLSDMPETRVHAATPSSTTGRRSWTSASRASQRAQQPAADLSHPAIAVNLDACIQCTRCVRACREEQVNDVIGYAFRGDALEDRVRPRRPDGRLDLRRLRRVRAGLPDRRADAGARRRPEDRPTRQVDSVCPYCGVGCQLTYHVKDNKILFVAGQGRPGEPRAACA